MRLSWNEIRARAAHCVEKPIRFLLTIIMAFTLFSCEGRDYKKDKNAETFLKEYKEMKNKLSSYKEGTYLSIAHWEWILGGPVLSEYEDYKTFKIKMGVKEQWWRSSKSPFSIYLDRDFVEGFTTEQRKNSQTAIDKLDCQAISNLELEGFLNIYPFLRPVFAVGNNDVDRQALIKVFDSVAYWRSMGPKYCETARLLKENYQFAREQGFVFSLYRAKYFDDKKFPFTRFPSDKKKAAFVNRCVMIGSIIGYAITQRYKPAIIMVLNLMGRADGITLLPDMEYYLRRKAEQLNITQDKLASHYKKLRKLLAKKEIATLDSRVETNKNPLAWVQRRNCKKDY